MSKLVILISCTIAICRRCDGADAVSPLALLPSALEHSPEPSQNRIGLHAVSQVYDDTDSIPRGTSDGEVWNQRSDSGESSRRPVRGSTNSQRPPKRPNNVTIPIEYCLSPQSGIGTPNYQSGLSSMTPTWGPLPPPPIPRLALTRPNTLTIPVQDCTPLQSEHTSLQRERRGSDHNSAVPPTPGTINHYHQGCTINHYSGQHVPFCKNETKALEEKLADQVSLVKKLETALRNKEEAMSNQPTQQKDDADQIQFTKLSFFIIAGSTGVFFIFVIALVNCCWWKKSKANPSSLIKKKIKAVSVVSNPKLDTVSSTNVLRISKNSIDEWRKSLIAEPKVEQARPLKIRCRNPKPIDEWKSINMTQKEPVDQLEADLFGEGCLDSNTYGNIMI